MKEISDAAYIAAAKAIYADTSDDNILIEDVSALDRIVVDRVPGAAWVMAWVYVSDEAAL